MGALIPLCVALFFNESSRWRIVAACAFFGCLYGVYISTARSGLLVLLVASGIYATLTFVNRFQYRWILLGGAALLLLVLTISASQAGDLLAEMIGHSTDNLNSARYREIMLGLTFDRAAESPLIGYGDGSAKWLAGITIDHSGSLATIDSQYLSVLLHNGYPGLVLWVGFLVVLIMMAVRNALEGATPYIRAVNSAIAAYVAGMMVGFSVLSIEDNMVMVYLFAGIVMADRLSTRSGPSRWERAVF